MYHRNLVCFQVFYKSFHLLDCLCFHKINNWNVTRNGSTGKKRFKVNKYDGQEVYNVPNNKLSRLKQHGYIYLNDSVSAGK